MHAIIHIQLIKSTAAKF